MTKVIFASITLALASACSPSGGGNDGGSDATPDGAQNNSCTGDFECTSAGDHCFFPIDGGCTVQGRSGTCVAYQAPSSCTPNVSCGCDGTTISVCAPPGLVDRASMSAGACPVVDAGDDASDASPE